MMHLGSRVSALLDGRLPVDEEEHAWAHVHECHPCRDLVEREGWVKTRLAGLSLSDRTGCAAPDRLKDSLLASQPEGRRSLDAARFATAPTGARPRHRSLAVIGGGAAGAAVVGMLALGAAGAPQLDRRAPSDLSRPAPSSNPTLEVPTIQPSPPSPAPRSGSRRGRPRSTMTAYVETLPEAPRVTMTP